MGQEGETGGSSVRGACGRQGWGDEAEDTENWGKAGKGRAGHTVQARRRAGTCTRELWSVGSWCVTGARKGCENSLFPSSWWGQGSTG